MGRALVTLLLALVAASGHTQTDASKGAGSLGSRGMDREGGSCAAEKTVIRRLGSMLLRSEKQQALSEKRLGSYLVSSEKRLGIPRVNRPESGEDNGHWADVDVKRLLSPRGPRGAGKGESERRGDSGSHEQSDIVAGEGLGESARELDAAENKAWDAASLTLRKNVSAQDAFIAGFGAGASGGAIEKANQLKDAEISALKRKLDEANDRLTKASAATIKTKPRDTRVPGETYFGGGVKGEWGDGGWDGNYMPPARLCRAGQDFQDSKVLSSFCRAVPPADETWGKKRMGDMGLFQKHPELNICPDKNGNYKFKYFMLPNIATNSSSNDQKYKIFAEDHTIPTKKRNARPYATQKSGPAGLLLNEIICVGQCQVPPREATAMRPGKDQRCKCNDGMMVPFYGTGRSRKTFWDVCLIMNEIMSWGQRLLCSTLTPYGCKTCGLGFDPQNEKTWTGEKLRKKGGGSMDEKQSITNSDWVTSKKNSFGKCPRWFQKSPLDSNKLTVQDETGLLQLEGSDGSCPNPYTPLKKWKKVRGRELGDGWGTAGKLTKRAKEKAKAATTGGLSMAGDATKGGLSMAGDATKGGLSMTGGASTYALRKTLNSLITMSLKFLPCLTTANSARISRVLLSIVSKIGNQKEFVAQLKKLFVKDGAKEFFYIIPNVVSCILHLPALVKVFTEVNENFESVGMYQKVCSNLDMINPTMGIDPIKGTVIDGTRKFVERSVVTMPYAEWGDKKFYSQHLHSSFWEGRIQSLQYLPFDPSESFAAAKPKWPAACADARKGCTQKDIVKWSTEFYDLKKHPNRRQLIQVKSSVMNLYMIRAPLDWYDTFETAAAMNWDHKPTLNGHGTYTFNGFKRTKRHPWAAASTFSFAWINCVHPVCMTSAKNSPVLRRVHHHRRRGMFVVSAPMDKCPDTMEERIKKCSKQRTAWASVTPGKDGLAQYEAMKKDPSKEIVMRPPSCASRARAKFEMCNTCCCKKGMISTEITHQLIHGKQDVCGNWLATVDAVVRVTFSMLRVSNVLDKFGARCFSNVKVDNPNKGTAEPADLKVCPVGPVQDDSKCLHALEN